jgi:threonine/homoserine/homoserine lactone efflux protein
MQFWNSYCLLVSFSDWLHFSPVRLPLLLLPLPVVDLWYGCSLPTLSLEVGSVRTVKSLPLTGALMSLANPYWIIWWATIGLSYVLSARDFGPWGVAAFFAGHILVDFLWYTFVSVGIHKGRKILPLKVYKGVIGVCALFLLGYAGFLIFNGVDRLIFVL